MDLYPHQLKVYDLLAQGKNVILRAPTGSGKTQASLYPFLAGMDKSSDLRGKLPLKCIYSVPMRVLAKQFHIEYMKTVTRYNTRYNTEIALAIQTGDMPQDPQLKSNLIFATIDQTLSSFLMSPYGLSRRRANLNLGAILSSYLVFDEFHLYSPDSTLPTTLQMLRMLRGITPFVLMTATFSDDLVMRLADKLDAEVVGLDSTDRALFRQLQSQDKTRRYHASSDILTADVVLDKHQGRSVVICNTVARARLMAKRLRERTQATDTEIILLHSQFLKEDRDRIEADIKERFGKNAPNMGSLIVVATQAIEVGVDITSTVMHTELAPANSIIQRAGRCARYPQNIGDVYLYRYVQNADDDPQDLYEKNLPYEGKLATPQSPATFEAFQGVSGNALTFEGEQEIINHVHAEADRQILNGLDGRSAQHRDKMFGAMRGDSENVSELIRIVTAQPITIHANPYDIENPYEYPAFSLHPGTIKKYASEWLAHWHEMPNAPEWVVKHLVYHEDADDGTEKSFYDVHSWEPRNNLYGEKPHIPYGTLVVVHPAFASYTAQDGFIPEAGGGWEILPTISPKTKSHDWNIHYKLETYAEHIRLVHKAAFITDVGIGHHAFWDELRWGARKLAQRLGVSFKEIQRAAELTILLHDVGKLSTGWQSWVRRYQEAVGQPIDPNEAYAHTFYQPKHYPEHWDIQRKLGKRPWHSVEGALAVDDMLIDYFENDIITTAIYSAITRHHMPFSYLNMRYALIENVSNMVKKTLPIKLQNDLKINLTTHAEKNIDLRHEYVIELNDMPHLDEINCFFLYAILVRLLRKSDVEGTIWGAKNVNLH